MRIGRMLAEESPQLAALMLEHDRSHAGELVALLRELGLAVAPELGWIAADEPVRKSA